MAVYFGKPQPSSGVVEGIGRLIQKKVSDLQRRHQIDERKATYKEANLPEWLAELPEEKQTLLLKEWQFLPEDEKEVVRDHLEKTGESLKSKQDAMMHQQGQQYEQQGQERLNQARQQPFQSPEAQGSPEEQQDYGNQQFKQAPMQQGTERYLESKRPRAESIPGLNSLVKAGEGFQKEPGSQANETQMFPQEGRGTMGQPAPFESAQQGPKKYRMVPKSGGEGGLKNELARQKQIDVQQKRPLNYLDAQAKHFTSLKSAADTARKMETILEKAGPEFPSQLVGALTSDNPLLTAVAIKNPLVREYIGLGNELISNLAGARKGAVTNFKLKLERASKADISQPIQTQLARLRSVIDAENKEGERIEYLESLADENGEYPQNIAGQGVKYDRAHENPLQYPSFFPEGTQDTDKNGVVREIKNGKWVKV